MEENVVIRLKLGKCRVCGHAAQHWAGLGWVGAGGGDQVGPPFLCRSYLKLPHFNTSAMVTLNSVEQLDGKRERRLIHDTLVSVCHIPAHNASPQTP